MPEKTQKKIQKNMPSINNADNSGKPEKTNNPLIIVGLGASAGGLEAFQEFFHEIPPESGMSYVVIQHLDPEHVSLLTEILQRTSLLPVIEAKNKMIAIANHVYVIPPNRDMSIKNGILQLCTPEQPRGQRMPINDFLTSLADDRQNRSIGIILSGTGTDGTLGLQSVMDAGGRTYAQDPTSAKYDGMPNSAISSGSVMKVMTPKGIAHDILKPLKNIVSGYIKKHSINDVKKNQSEGILHILLLLRQATGHDFTQYKKSTIRRRIERCMATRGIYDSDTYAKYLKSHPKEMQILLNELLINVTSFFRDPEAFTIIANEILPLLCNEKSEGDTFRVWVAGCASGEEAYSIAILLREYMDRTRTEFKIQIYATDLDEESISEARAGVYTKNIVDHVGQERINRFFIEEDDQFRVKREIRDSVIFAVQNVIKDPPLSRLDLLCCRNLMIYLEPELQNKLIPIFHYALNPLGVLFLSPAESIGNHTERFLVLSRKYKLYQAIKTSSEIKNSIMSQVKWTSNESGADRELSSHKEQSSAENRATEFTMNKINHPTHDSSNKHLASREDLKSTNEELQSTNEELQSTNEELETSKEELQSVNEELVTVNTELQKKIEQLAGMQNDMKNLLDNMNIGTIFLDKDLIIRRFTREATKAFRLISTDVGRSLEDIKCTLIGSLDLLAKAKDVLTTLNPFEAELLSESGKWYLAHIQPYRTLDNIIDGVVLTFTDITTRVNAVEAVKSARTLAEGIVDTVLEPLIVLDADLKVVSASRSFYQYFHVSPEKTVGRLIYDLGNQQWNIPALRDLLESILPKQKSFEGYVMEHKFQNIGIQKMLLNARTIFDSRGNTQLILFAMQPVQVDTKSSND